MRIGREDYTGEELLTPPWRRRSNLMLLLVCALVASLAAGPIVRDFFPVSAAEPLESEPKQVRDIAAEWDVAVPEGLGEVVFSQVVPGHVLVAGKRGFAVLDAATGERLWGEEYGWDADRPMGGQWARQSLRIVGDALLVAIPSEDGGAPPPVRVVELHTGELRFTAPDGDYEDFRAVPTVEGLVVETCANHEDCVLSGLSWQDGGRKWRQEYDDEAQLPLNIPQGVVEGQTDLRNFAPSAYPVPSRTLAVVADHAPRDKIRYEAIDLSNGERIRQWDTTDVPEEAPEYIVAGSLLVEYSETAAAIIEPDSGEEVHSLRGRVGGLFPEQFYLSLMDETSLVDVYAGDSSTIEDGYDEFRVIDVESGQVPMETDAATGFLLGGELDTVVMLTGTGSEDRPELRGLDVGTGDTRWTTSLHPEGAEMNGFQAEAVVMVDNHVAVTGSPSSWTGGDYFGGARTHVVDLDTGEIRRIDDTLAQAMGHNSLLGLRNPPTHADDPGEARLAFYQL